MSTLSAAQLADLVAKWKRYRQISDDDASFLADGIAVFCSATDATAATVQVTDTTVVLVITDGANAGTTTLTLADAANDTLGELATVIDGTAGWTANLVGDSGATSTLLLRLVATNALGQANEQTLQYENEALLEWLITNALAGIESELCRGLLSCAYSELYDRERRIVLEQPDVTSVDSIFTEVCDGLTVKYTGSDTHARVQVSTTAVTITSRAGATATSNELTFASNVSTDAMATAVAAVADWTSSSLNSAPAAYLLRRGASNAKDRQVTLEYWDYYDGEYEVFHDAGVIEFTCMWSGWPTHPRVRIDYTAGFSSLPGDVEQALLDAVTMAYTSTSVDPSLKSERLGDYSYDRGSLEERARQSGASIAANKLSKYRRTLP